MTGSTRLLLRGRPDGPEEVEIPGEFVPSPMLYGRHEYELTSEVVDGRTVFVHMDKCVECSG